MIMTMRWDLSVLITHEKSFPPENQISLKRGGGPWLYSLVHTRVCFCLCDGRKESGNGGGLCCGLTMAGSFLCAFGSSSSSPSAQCTGLRTKNSCKISSHA